MRFLVFQHVASEHPGIFRKFFAADGISWDAVELDAGEAIPPLDNYDALWVMGGPMDVWDIEGHPWLVDEKRAIRHWVRDLERPFVGLCLGHQLLADALGGTCGPQRPPEIGILDVELTPAAKNDPVFATLPTEFKAVQWHSVRVAQPPDDAVILAKSDICPCQAMRVGKTAWSMQYHVEVEDSTIDDWGKIPAYAEALERTHGHGALPRMAAAAKPFAANFATGAESFYRNFMRAIRA
ncbi:MAG: type 1 glutamine amidotransferase [Hyphomicrobium sp.]|uniref:type 1 glutamine amidotransferase n=1 Tax=Hyphomicrobium sp. TaxID=82 RepID=UPI0039E6DFDC